MTNPKRTSPPFSTDPIQDMNAVLRQRAQMVQFLEGLIEQAKAGQLYGVGVATVTPAGLGSGWSMMCDGWLLNGAIARLTTHFEHSVLHTQLDDQLAAQKALQTGALPPHIMEAIRKGMASTMTDEEPSPGGFVDPDADEI